MSTSNSCTCVPSRRTPRSAQAEGRVRGGRHRGQLPASRPIETKLHGVLLAFSPRSRSRADTAAAAATLGGAAAATTTTITAAEAFAATAASGLLPTPPATSSAAATPSLRPTAVRHNVTLGSDILARVGAAAAAGQSGPAAGAQGGEADDGVEVDVKVHGGQPLHSASSACRHTFDGACGGAAPAALAASPDAYGRAATMPLSSPSPAAAAAAAAALDLVEKRVHGGLSKRMSSSSKRSSLDVSLLVVGSGGSTAGGAGGNVVSGASLLAAIEAAGGSTASSSGAATAAPPPHGSSSLDAAAAAAATLLPRAAPSPPRRSLTCHGPAGFASSRPVNIVAARRGAASATGVARSAHPLGRGAVLSYPSPGSLELLSGSVLAGGAGAAAGAVGAGSSGRAQGSLLQRSLSQRLGSGGAGPQPLLGSVDELAAEQMLLGLRHADAAAAQQQRQDLLRTLSLCDSDVGGNGAGGPPTLLEAAEAAVAAAEVVRQLTQQQLAAGGAPPPPPRSSDWHAGARPAAAAAALHHHGLGDDAEWMALLPGATAIATSSSSAAAPAGGDGKLHLQLLQLQPGPRGQAHGSNSDVSSLGGGGGGVNRAQSLDAGLLLSSEPPRHAGGASASYLVLGGRTLQQQQQQCPLWSRSAAGQAPLQHAVSAQLSGGGARRVTAVAPATIECLPRSPSLGVVYKVRSSVSGTLAAAAGSHALLRPSEGGGASGPASAAAVAACGGQPMSQSQDAPAVLGSPVVRGLASPLRWQEQQQPRQPLAAPAAARPSCEGGRSRRDDGGGDGDDDARGSWSGGSRLPGSLSTPATATAARGSASRNVGALLIPEGAGHWLAQPKPRAPPPAFASSLAALASARAAAPASWAPGDDDAVPASPPSSLGGSQRVGLLGGGAGLGAGLLFKRPSLLEYAEAAAAVAAAAAAAVGTSPTAFGQRPHLPFGSASSHAGSFGTAVLGGCHTLISLPLAAGAGGARSADHYHTAAAAAFKGTPH